MKKTAWLFAACMILLLVSCSGGSGKKTSSYQWSSSSGSYSPSHEKHVMYVISDGLNIRKEPGANYKVVGVLKLNDKVLTEKRDLRGWYDVETPDENIKGYVNAAYLSDSPLTEAEIAARKAAAQAAAAATAAKDDEKSEPKLQEHPAVDVGEGEINHPVLTKRPKAGETQP